MTTLRVIECEIPDVNAKLPVTASALDYSTLPSAFALYLLKNNNAHGKIYEMFKSPASVKTFSCNPSGNNAGHPGISIIKG